MKPYILALDAGGTFLKAGLFTNGMPITESLLSVPVNSDGSAEDVHTAYSKLLLQMKHRAQELSGVISGVCVDTPGPFDYSDGISRMTHKYTAIYGVPLRPWFREILGDIPVLFLHDSSAFILGTVKAENPYRRIAGVMIGTGLGFAMMMDGRVCVTDQGSPLVSIYKRPYRNGIAEDAVSAGGIVRAYNQLAEAPLPNAKEIAVLAKQGEPLAKRIYETMGYDLGKILQSILKENEMEALFLGGQISRDFALFEEPLKDALRTVPSLRLIAPAPDIDLVHLTGAARYWRYTKETAKTGK